MLHLTTKFKNVAPRGKIYFKLDHMNGLCRIVFTLAVSNSLASGADLGGGCRGCAPPPPPEMTCGFLIQLVFCKKKTMWFIGVEVEQETSAPPPKKNPGSAPEHTLSFPKTNRNKIQTTDKIEPFSSVSEWSCIALYRKKKKR